MNINELKQKFFLFLKDNFSEKNIISVIDDYIYQLKNIKENLTKEDIEFLKELKFLKNRLIYFSELLEEIEYITDFEQYNEFQNELKGLLKVFQGYGFEKRIQKEIRELSEKLYEINKLEEKKKNISINKRIAELESQSPKCRFGHNMVIRGDENSGYFWGCSLFPDCFSKHFLKREELQFLEGEIVSPPHKQFKSEDKNVFQKDLPASVLSNTDEPVVADQKTIKNDFNNKLYEILKSTRLKLAKEMKLPAFCIFRNDTLVEMVNSLPSNKSEMLNIKGVGESNYTKYGKIFLELIQNFYTRIEAQETGIQSKSIDKEKDLNDEERILFDKLFGWKERKIREKRLVSYAIANEKALKIAAKIKPNTYEELREIKGFSLSALEAFHSEILEIIKGIQTTENRSQKENFFTSSQNRNPRDFENLTPYELGICELREAIPYIIEYLKKGSINERRLAASAISKLSNLFPEDVKKAIPYLINNLSDDSPQLRQYTLKSLLSLSFQTESLSIFESIAIKDDKKYNRKLAKAILDKHKDIDLISKSTKSQHLPSSYIDHLSKKIKNLKNHAKLKTLFEGAIETGEIRNIEQLLSIVEQLGLIINRHGRNYLGLRFPGENRSFRIRYNFNEIETEKNGSEIDSKVIFIEEENSCKQSNYEENYITTSLLSKNLKLNHHELLSLLNNSGLIYKNKEGKWRLTDIGNRIGGKYGDTQQKRGLEIEWPVTVTESEDFKKLLRVDLQNLPAQIKNSNINENGSIMQNNSVNLIDREHAEMLLKQAIGDVDAQFRDGQWDAIDRLVNQNEKLLVVQRTGWGKSSVYFISTRILRDRGSGPTLIVSPLLALMRNQIAAATRLNIHAATINSSNQDEWENVKQDILDNNVDAVLISPERLANPGFIEDILLIVADRIGLVVVDEAHCISDWGHDFRPDYRRMVKILQQMPPNMPVLGTTATANDRVVNDILEQLGEITILRGTLVRESLSLMTLRMPDQGARLAWLAQTIPNLPGTGVVYTLTKRDAKQVTQWLKQNRISAEAYYSGVEHPDFENTNKLRQHREDQLLNNEIKVLVATVALGMGYDKPDLAFVIHYQAPGSVVAYYQQVGRAGRAIDQAYGVLMSGREDDEIHEYFRRSAFPSEDHVNKILAILEQHDGLSIVQLQKHINLTQGQIEKVLKYLSVENPSPVIKDGPRWRRTPVDYVMDQDRIRRLTSQRENEWQEMQGYIDTQECLMTYLRHALDDTETEPCERCATCLGEPLFSIEIDHELSIRAAHLLKHADIELKPKARVATGAFTEYGFRGNLSPELRAEHGRILSRWGDAGWGRIVAEDKHNGQFRNELVVAVAEMVQERWNPNPVPKWLTCVPSRNHPTLVPEFASRLAFILEIPFVEAIIKVRDNEQQKFQQNRFHQCRNLDGVFQIIDTIPEGPVFLVDDVVDSGWTLTVITALLRQAGSDAVFPIALATTKPGD